MLDSQTARTWSRHCAKSGQPVATLLSMLSHWLPCPPKIKPTLGLPACFLALVIVLAEPVFSVSGVESASVISALVPIIAARLAWCPPQLRA